MTEPILDNVPGTKPVLEVPNLPAIEGVVSAGLILRESAGEGKLGDATVVCSSTAGCGGFALIVEVEPPGGDRVYVVYNAAPLVEKIAAAVLDAVAARG